VNREAHDRFTCSAGGVGFHGIEGRTASSDIVERRTDVLRLVLALCSGPLFMTPDPAQPVSAHLLTSLRVVATAMVVGAGVWLRRRALASWTN